MKTNELVIVARGGRPNRITLPCRTRHPLCVVQRPDDAALREELMRLLGLAIETMQGMKRSDTRDRRIEALKQRREALKKTFDTFEAVAS